MWLAIKFAEDVEKFWVAANPDDNSVLVLIDKAKYNLSKELYRKHTDQRPMFLASSDPLSMDGRARMAINTAIGAVIGNAITSACYAVAARQDFSIGMSGFEYVSNMIKANLEYIIDYKFENKQKYNSIGQIFEAASDSDKEKLLFCLGDM